MQEGEQGIIALVGDAQIVQPALPRRQPVRLERLAAAGQGAEQRPSAIPEQCRMPQLVLCVAQVQPAQQRVAGQLRRPGQIAAAVRFGLGEAQELAGSPVRIPPDPAVQRPQRAIECGRTNYFLHARDASTG